MKVGLGSFLHKPACSSPSSGQYKARLFHQQSIRGGARAQVWSSVFTHIRPLFISQGSHSVNESRGKNSGKYKPFRLRDLSALLADCLTQADPL